MDSVLGFWFIGIPSAVTLFGIYYGVMRCRQRRYENSLLHAPSYPIPSTPSTYDGSYNPEVTA